MNGAPWAPAFDLAPEAADEPGARSTAFPAIATGVHGNPAEEAARIAVSVLRGRRPVSGGSGSWPSTARPTICSPPRS
ncbi:macro domain-containing protein [Actinacidiphila glaucinigra]|uniref:macro domain-containing protein n=1 Tax=Actinacidiphila glaucinigra TaxID=235986 RepID=UPI0035E33472